MLGSTKNGGKEEHTKPGQGRAEDALPAAQSFKLAATTHPPLGTGEPRPSRAQLTFASADQKVAVRRDAAEGQIHHGPRVARASQWRLPHGHGGGERGDAERGPRVAVVLLLCRGASGSLRAPALTPTPGRESPESAAAEGGTGREGGGEGSAGEPARYHSRSTPVAAGSDGAPTRRVAGSDGRREGGEAPRRAARSRVRRREVRAPVLLTSRGCYLEL